MIIRSPLSQEDFDKYYLLRYQVLRAPWGKEKGSEKDQFEDDSIHRIALLKNKVIAVGRLHLINISVAQIRYMAVNKEYEGRGLGSRLLVALEDVAREKNIKTIILDARETAVSFYEKHSYQLQKKSHLLFNEIQHYKMQKKL